MLNIKLFTFNAFQENTYLISNEDKQCWIIDPGMYDADEVHTLTYYITTQKLKPVAIINTHAHIDHIFGVIALQTAYNIPFYLHPDEGAILAFAQGSAAMFGFTLTETPKPDQKLVVDVPLMLGEDRIDVLFTPGHSPGSVSFYYSKGGWVVSGDALFSGSIGRTDLPGGNFDQLIASIKSALFTLPDNTIAYPGHGPSTTIGYEKQTNPFLK